MYKIFRDVCFNSSVIKKDDSKHSPITNTNTNESYKPREWLPIENYPSQADLHAVWIAIDKMFAAWKLGKCICHLSIVFCL